MSDFPVDITIQRLILRLRCHACGQPPATAALDGGEGPKLNLDSDGEDVVAGALILQGF